MDEKWIVAVAEVFTGVGTMLTAGAAVYAAKFGLRQYKVGLRQYRARSLIELSERFYRSEEYKEVYLAFDDCDADLLGKIRKVLNAGARDPTDRDIEWKLARYLNFFEMALCLVERSELGVADLKSVLDWPLRCLASQPSMREYLANHGYERLAKVEVKVIEREAAGSKQASAAPNDPPGP